MTRARVARESWASRVETSQRHEGSLATALLQDLGVDLGLASTTGPMPCTVEGTPTFRDFTVDIALSLIAAFRQSATIAPEGLEWCERLMRYSEIFRHELDDRARQKWSSVVEARCGMLALVALLAEATRVSGETRYLNTAMKVLDRPFVFDVSIFRGKDGSLITLATLAVLTVDSAFRMTCEAAGAA